MPATGALPLAQLAWHCPVAELGFATTDELPDVDGAIGQVRAQDALRYALESRHGGYNAYALGPEGLGKRTLVERLLEAQAQRAPAADDWCYVSDFRELRTPRLLRLPPGKGGALRHGMERLLADLLPALRNAFENAEYRTRRQVIEEELKERQEHAVGEVEELARQKSMALIRSPMGLAFAPLVAGHIVTPEKFHEMPLAERERIEAAVHMLEERLRDALANVPRWMQETRDKLRALNETTAAFAVNYLFDTLRPLFDGHAPAQAYLDEARQDIIDHVEMLLELPPKGGNVALDDGPMLFRRYRVNLLVDNSARSAAPVVMEPDPTFERLVGRIEHRAEMGALVTDFLMIRPGALHRANGGYLVLEAQKLLARPMAYDGLKRALATGVVRIESAFQSLGLPSTVGLEPEPMPLAVKVVLTGERLLYHLLVEFDREFARLFRVAADFDERVARDAATCTLYARLLATLCRKERLRPLSAAAVGVVLEHAARRAGDAEQLSTDIDDLADLLREADHLAAGSAAATIDEAIARRALDTRQYRLARIRERNLEQLVQGTVAIASSGAVVGQVNGLSVVQVGGFAFGQPSRITARVRAGAGQVVDIERETRLGGPLHSKGVLILQGFVAGHFAADVPLSLHASLVFEQSYGGVEGDSASSAELYALLSAIAEIPLRQDLAVTGSVNQHGEVQAIGGVNEKVEGFFDLCAARGLSGTQGVLIPATNVRHLMLHERVTTAVAAGRFNVYAVSDVAAGIELLSGLPAGARDADGLFTAGSVYRRVEDRLRTLAEVRQRFRGGTSAVATPEDDAP